MLDISVLGAAGNPLNVSLHDRWSFQQEGTDRWYPAEVPGCVHTDLMKNDLIPDPFFGTNEQSLQWIGEKNWIYETEFSVPTDVLKKQVVELVFEGLDTYADVILNDSLVLKTNNMFRTWRVDCKNLLRPDGNRIRVRFKNVFGENLPKYKSAPYELQAFPNNDQADVRIAMYSRKAQFHYGWDWGPRLITCGVWRPVFLEAWDKFTIKTVHIQQENVSTAGADCISVVDVFSSVKQKISLSIFIDSLKLSVETYELSPGTTTITVKGHLANPELWWTNGLGAQHLYTYRAVVEDNAGVRDEYTTKIGIRSVEVVRENDTDGKSIFVRLNGIPVFMKGANYIPQDNFQNRVTAERCERIVRSAAEANMNMLRVWGGGIYEDDRFYELCDRYGILLWQEMMFACAMYPGDEEFLASVRQEVVDNVIRIRNHPCVAMYCGNNENEIGWYQWGWKEKYSEEEQSTFERNVDRLFRDVIPSALREADSTRYYHPTSPIAGFQDTPASEGDIHYWGVWHGKEPFESYQTNLARFVSEYGFQSYPELPTIEKFTATNDRDLHSAVMLSHQRCMADEREDKEYGNRLIRWYMDRWYRTPKDFTSYVYVSQVLQAEGVRMAMEAHRRAMPYCMGSLYWQIDDCWPAASWSSIDYYGRWKALHYAAKKSYAPVLVSTVVADNAAHFFAVSDLRDTVDALVEISVIDFNGLKVFERSLPVVLKPNSSQRIVTLQKETLAGSVDLSRLAIITRLKQDTTLIAENIAYWTAPGELELENPEIKTVIRDHPSGFSVELTTNTLAKNVYVTCTDEGARCSDNFFDLIPGTQKTIVVSTVQNREQFEQTLKMMSLVNSFR